MARTYKEDVPLQKLDQACGEVGVMILRTGHHGTGSQSRHVGTETVSAGVTSDGCCVFAGTAQQVDDSVQAGAT